MMIELRDEYRVLFKRVGDKRLFVDRFFAAFAASEAAKEAAKAEFHRRNPGEWVIVDIRRINE